MCVCVCVCVRACMCVCVCARTEYSSFCTEFGTKMPLENTRHAVPPSSPPSSVFFFLFLLPCLFRWVASGSAGFSTFCADFGVPSPLANPVLLPSPRFFPPVRLAPLARSLFSSSVSLAVAVPVVPFNPLLFKFSTFCIGFGYRVPPPPQDTGLSSASNTPRLPSSAVLLFLLLFLIRPVSAPATPSSGAVPLDPPRGGRLGKEPISSSVLARCFLCCSSR